MSAYQKFDRKVLNPQHKNLGKLNRNFFYISTLVVIGLLCLCFFVFEPQIEAVAARNIFVSIALTPIQHDSTSHLVENLIAFFVVSIFLERHFGSIKYIFLIVLAGPLASIAVLAFSQSWPWTGFSGINYFLYALLLWTLIFNFRGYFFGKVRWIFPVVILGLLSLLVCWNGDYSKWPDLHIQFGCFTDLCGKVTHWSAMIIGAIVGLFAQIFSLGKGRLKNKTLDNNGKAGDLRKTQAKKARKLNDRERKNARKIRQLKSKTPMQLGSGKSAVKAMTKSRKA